MISVLAVCGVHGEERDRLIALSQEHEQPNWFQLDPFPNLRMLIDYESKATAVKQFENNLVPGLLQTEGYMRATIAAAVWLSPEEIEERVKRRLGRKRLLIRPNPPRLTYYIHEFALRLPVGGPEIMSEQLHKLLRYSVRPNLELRVVPVAIGAHAATRGSFLLMEFTEMSPLIYLDTEASCIYLETAREVGVHRTILADLRRVSLDDDESRELIAKLAVELYANGEDQEPIERPHPVTSFVAKFAQAAPKNTAM